MIVPAAIVALAAAGGRASLLMLRKSQLSDDGLLDGFSVVRLPEAKLFFGVPNSVFGIAFYALAIAGQVSPPGATRELVRRASTYGAAFAAPISVYLAMRLLAQRLDCANCWTAHAVNAGLFPLLVLQATRASDEPG